MHNDAHRLIAFYENVNMYEYLHFDLSTETCYHHLFKALKLKISHSSFIIKLIKFVPSISIHKGIILQVTSTEAIYIHILQGRSSYSRKLCPAEP